MRVLPLALLLSACNNGHESATEYHPAVSFLAPEEGEVVPIGDLQVSIVVDDFVLTAPETARLTDWLSLVIPQAQAHNEDGEPQGYCDLALDDGHVLDLSEAQGNVSVEAGEHTLTCALKFADGDELDPPISTSVSFEAEE